MADEKPKKKKKELTAKQIAQIKARLEKAYPATFKPQPTVMTGGLGRMLQCWEAMRDINGGGYGGGFLKSINGWGTGKHLGDTIKCSPFTGSVIAMMLDPATDPTGDNFAPTYDGDKKVALPFLFYGFHNTSADDEWKVGQPLFHDNGWTKRNAAGGETDPYSAVGAIVFFNLGYEIDPRDMRRGDLIKIEWSNRGGHSTFCWDAHLGADGAADSFLYLSANSGAGVSISTNPKLLFLPLINKKYVKSPKTPSGKLFDDCEEYVTKGNWQCVPGHEIDPEAVKKSGTFRKPPAHVTGGKKGFHAASIRVVRFWGFPPPDKSTTRGKAAWGDPAYAKSFEQALKLSLGPHPVPYCMGSGPTVSIAVSNVKPQSLPAEKAKQPDALAKVTAQPVVQKSEDAVPHQHKVEHDLKKLHHAKRIRKDPGDPGVINDAQTIEAIKDFQARWGLLVDGIAGTVTRSFLFQAVADLESGKTFSIKPAPELAQPPKKPESGQPKAKHKKRPPAPSGDPILLGPVQELEPVIKHFGWLSNHALSGGEIKFSIEGEGLDIWNFGMAKIVFKHVTNASELSVSVPVPFTVGGRGEGTVKLPPSMPADSSWTATLECSAGGGLIKKKSDVVLSVYSRLPDERVASDTGGWPWDERLWPRKMRDIVNELRGMAPPSAPYQAQWCLSTYGVKEKTQSLGPRDPKNKSKRLYENAGDLVPVIDGKGNEFGKVTRYSLWAADIEGTLRLGTRVFNITRKGRPRHGEKPHHFEEFDPSSSWWHDVTEACPWGGGSKLPLIPFRVLAVNSRHDTDKYFKTVFVHALKDKVLTPTGEKHNGWCVIGDCGDMETGKQFDFFKGREDIPFVIDDGLGKYKNNNKTNLPLSWVSIMDRCKATIKK